jgi:hypothetical protein
MDIENGKRLRWTDPEMNRPWPIHVPYMEDLHFLKKKNPSCDDDHAYQ